MPDRIEQIRQRLERTSVLTGGGERLKLDLTLNRDVKHLLAIAQAAQELMPIHDHAGHATDCPFCNDLNEAIAALHDENT